MTAEILNELRPVHVTEDEIAHAIRIYFFGGKRSSDVHFYLPSPSSLEGSFALKDVLTSIEQVHLNGYRLVTFGQPPASTKIMEIHRENAKVTKSRSFDPREQITKLLTFTFLETFGNSMSAFSRLPGVSNHLSENTVVSHALTTQLLVDSLTKEVPPEIVPKVIYPSQERLGPIAYDVIKPKFPFEYDAIFEKYKITAKDGKFLYEAFGERGELQESKEFQNESDAIAAFAASFMYLPKDGLVHNSRFRPYSIEM